MRRRLLFLVIGLSALAFAAVCVLWLRDVDYTWDIRYGGVSRSHGPRLGFRVQSGPADGLQYVWSLPYWKALALSALAAILCALRLCSVRRRFRTGYCARCGYDLRATPDRCPECGNAAA